MMGWEVHREEHQYPVIRLKVTFIADRERLIDAAWAVKCDPARRLSKKSVLDQLAEWYQEHGNQLDAMEAGEIDVEDWTASQQEKITEWVNKTWPEVSHA